MITRKEYMDADKLHNGAYCGIKGSDVHAAYFSQFVTDSMKKYVADFIGAEALLASRDWHLNDCRTMEVWDGLPMSPETGRALRAAGDNLSLSTKCCVWKQAARLWLAENGGLPAWPVRYRYPDMDYDLRGYAIGETAREAADLMQERNRMYAFVEPLEEIA